MRSIKFLLLGSLMATSFNASSQPCDKATVANINGKWTEGMKGSTSGLSAAELAKEKTIVAEVHKMLQANYKPIGLDADFNGTFPGYKDEYRYSNVYGYVLRFMPYTCDGTNLGKAHETNTSLTILFNNTVFGPEIYEPFIDGSPWDEGFRSMNKLPRLENGIYKYEEKTGLGFGVEGVQHTWILSRDNQLPFVFVTKKEFLEKKKTKLEQGMQQEKERLKNGKPEILQKSMAQFEAAITKVTNELTNAGAGLYEKAIVRQDPKDYLSHLFVDGNDPFARILIKPNPSYFDKKLPKTAVQFITIVLKGDPKNAAMNKAMTDIQKAIDMNKLKSLIGK